MTFSFMRKLTIFIIMAVCLGGIIPFVSAQTDLEVIRAYPINGITYRFKLSPDGRTAAFYNDEWRILPADVDRALYRPTILLDLTSGTVSDQIESEGFTISLMQSAGMKRLSGPSDFSSDVVFTSDGSTLISFHENGDIYTWDVETGEQLSDIQMPFIQFRELTFRPGSNQLLSMTGYQLTSFALWDVTDFSVKRIFGFPYDSAAVYQESMSDIRQMYETQLVTYTLSPDGTRIIASNGNDNLFMFTLPGGEITTLLPGRETPGTASITDLRFTPDGKSLYYTVYGTDDRTPVIRRLDFTDGQAGEPVTLERGGAPFALSPDGQRLAWFEEANGVYTLYVSDLDQTKIVPVFATRSQVRSRLSSLQFTPDGSQLIFGGLITLDFSNALFIIPVP